MCVCVCVYVCMCVCVCVCVCLSLSLSLSFSHSLSPPLSLSLSDPPTLPLCLSSFHFLSSHKAFSFFSVRFIHSFFLFFFFLNYCCGCCCRFVSLQSIRPSLLHTAFVSSSFIHPSFHLVYPLSFSPFSLSLFTFRHEMADFEIMFDIFLRDLAVSGAVLQKTILCV